MFDSVKTVTVFVDNNCGGQNKSSITTIIVNALHQVHLNKFLRVEFVFLVSGHSYMPRDWSFDVVEKAVRLYVNIYTYDDYVSIIEKSQENKPFCVNCMEHSDFYDLKKMLSVVTLRKVGEAKFSKTRQLVVTSNYKEGYLIILILEMTPP